MYPPGEARSSGFFQEKIFPGLMFCSIGKKTSII
jgi:hypothetical protein